VKKWVILISSPISRGQTALKYLISYTVILN
jgi:hypothetical protein